MKNIRKPILMILGVSILLMMLSGCTGEKSANELTGVWIERNSPNPINLAMSEDGSYIRYRENEDTKTVLDEGRWRNEKKRIIYNTTLGLEGSISNIDLNMRYDIKKSKDGIYLSIKTDDGTYFEGDKKANEGNL